MTHSAGHAQTLNPALRMAATTVGGLFLVVGILGFIPGVTTQYSQMTFAGPQSQAMLLGIFQVSMLHNIVHIVLGVAGLAMARRSETARAYLIGGGVIYLIVWIYGLVVDLTTSANFLPVNTADNWLHLGLGFVMVALGLILSRPTGMDRSHTMT